MHSEVKGVEYDKVKDEWHGEVYCVEHSKVKGAEEILTVNLYEFIIPIEQKDLLYTIVFLVNCVV